ncbi:MAG: hypothetical protein E6Q92_00875 [Burkholderiaceae bacterium]|nr:MAG: hypothetical protein E6Q92_00875 [Burkholderiaceae bacterium]
MIKHTSFAMACLASAAALTASSAQAAPERLFQEERVQRLSVPSAQGQAAEQAVMHSDRKVKSRRDGLRANAQAAQAQELEIPLTDGSKIYASRVNSYKLRSGSDVWVGRHAGTLVSGRLPAQEQSVIVWRGGRAYGVVEHGDKIYRIHANAKGEHSVIEVDTSRFPRDHADAAYRNLLNESINKQARDLVAPAPKTTVKALAAPAAADAQPVIKLLVNYTAQAKTAAAAAGQDIDALIDLSLALTNQGYVNSGVNAKVEMVYKAQVTYTQSGTQSLDRDRYAAKNDGYMDNIHTQRDQYGADVGMLFVDDGDESCGIAKAIGATADSAFAVVHWDCATDNFSFGHELGHLYGARHNAENDGTTTPFAYGHGYWAPNQAWRTIMAYQCSGKTCPRLNYWSNPGVNYTDGQAMGNTSTAHNARVLTERAATLAAFRADAGGADTTAPTVSLASSASGKSLTFTATATDNVGVAKVEFVLDGTVNATVTAAPYSKVVDTSTLAAGAHTMVAKAYDAAGNVGSSTTLSFSVDNTAPTVSLAGSASGTTQNFTATASDNVGVTKVEFWLDGALNATDTASPYTLALDTTKVANGTHSMVAKAYDAAGNVASSTAVSFSVNNTSTSVTEGSAANDTIATAVKLATNVGSVTGTVSAKTDVDYYAVTLAAGQTLTVGMTGPSGTDYDLNLVNASGTVLAKSTGSTSTESMSYKATTATTVYVKVFSYSGSSTTSTYKLTITYK